MAILFDPISDFFCVFDNTHQLSSEPSNKRGFENCVVVQWLGLCTLTAKSPGSIPGWGTKIPQAVQRYQKQNKTKPGGNLMAECAAVLSDTI